MSAYGKQAENDYLINFRPLWLCLHLKEAQFHTGSDKIGFRSSGSNLVKLRTKTFFARAILKAAFVKLEIFLRVGIRGYYLSLFSAI